MLIPAWLVASVTFINVIILIIWAYRANKIHESHAWLPIALLIPMLYLTFLYFVVADTLLVTEIQLYGRDGFFVLLLCDAIVYAKLAGLLGGTKYGP